MSEYEIVRIDTYYENYLITLKNLKIKGKYGDKVDWVYISPENLNAFLKGKKIKGNLVKKRTRTWLE